MPQKLLNAPAGKLVDNNEFKDYFKGIYFKIENASGRRKAVWQSFEFLKPVKLQ